MRPQSGTKFSAGTACFRLAISCLFDSKIGVVNNFIVTDNPKQHKILVSLAFEARNWPVNNFLDDD